MKPLPFSLFLLAMALSTHTSAQSEDSKILATRGKGVVTQDSFAARADKIPKHLRVETLRNPTRFRDVINVLLIRSQMAADARDAGFDDQPLVQARIRLAAEKELGEAWLQHYVEMQPPADFEALAFEYYQLNKDKLKSSPEINVSHILISTKERPDADAKEIADEVRLKLVQEPASFNELVAQYSEDPSKSVNNGKFVGIGKGEMAKPFEDAAFAMSDGEISEPVKTTYGYHIILLDEHLPATIPGFAVVKQQLMEEQRNRYAARIQEEYVAELTAETVEMGQDALEEMVKRQLEEVAK